MLAVIATLKVKEAKTDQAVEEFKKLVASVRNEEGTLSYSVNRDRTDPQVFVVIERYKDDAAFAAHSGSPYLAEFFARSKDFLAASPHLMMLDEIASI
jgi:quinol monooxygenase YgiN